MMRGALRGTAVIALFLFVAACVPATAPVVDDGRVPLTLRGPQNEEVVVRVETATTPQRQALGLMHRTELAQDTGMLFIFQAPMPLSFWMKDTLIPLDILFFDAQGRLVSLHHMVPCTADPCPTYASGGLAQYALEVPAGFAASRGIDAQWTLGLPVAGLPVQP